MSEGIVLPTHPTFKNLIGKRFGRLVVIAYAGKSPRGQTVWLCLCDCGNEKRIGVASIGRTKSCGCLSSDTTAARNFTHGDSHTPTHKSWMSMLDRCRNANRDNFKHYGGRGISVCERWQSYENFLEDMGARPAGSTLDRIDNDGNYEPGNCRWATHREQGRNTSRNRMLTAKGETRCLKEWSQITGTACMVILGRITRGWSIEDAIFRPVRKNTPPLTESDRPAIMAMRAAGMTLADIGMQYGKSGCEMSRFVGGKKYAKGKPVRRPKIADVIGKPTGSAKDGGLIVRKPEGTK